ncbi:MAG: cytochrome c-type biogenesis protein [Rhodovibrionaceae bacterium]|nr:cytochrome c-type biogenesis protein [Rhodovibrionaceae bacterium]
MLSGLLLLAMSTAGAWAVEPDEILDDPALEQRAREISKNIRCVVCQNESIDTSNADLAKDMRVLIRERIQAGDSNAEVKAYLVERYGDYVLLKPPVRPATYLLWFGPLAVLLLGAAGVAVYFRRRPSFSEASSAAAPLTSEEEKRLHELLDDPNEADARHIRKPDAET